MRDKITSADDFLKGTTPTPQRLVATMLDAVNIVSMIRGAKGSAIRMEAIAVSSMSRLQAESARILSSRIFTIRTIARSWHRLERGGSDGIYFGRTDLVRQSTRCSVCSRVTRTASRKCHMLAVSHTLNSLSETRSPSNNPNQSRVPISRNLIRRIAVHIVHIAFLRRTALQNIVRRRIACVLIRATTK